MQEGHVVKNVLHPFLRALAYLHGQVGIGCCAPEAGLNLPTWKSSLTMYCHLACLTCSEATITGLACMFTYKGSIYWTAAPLLAPT